MKSRYHLGYTILGTYELTATNQDEAEAMLRQVDPKLLLEDSEFVTDYVVRLQND